MIDHSRQTFDTVKADLYVRASRKLEGGDTKAAEELYREAIAKYPKDIDGYEALGACLYFDSRYDEAKAEYMRALQLNDRSGNAHYGLGCVAHKQKRYDEAREQLTRALTLGGDEGKSHYVLAMVFDETGDKTNAVIHYERAVALDPIIAKDAGTQHRLRELKQ